MGSGWLCGVVGDLGEFEGLSVQRLALWWVWDSLGIWGIECAAGGFVVGVGQFGGFGGLSVLWVALWWVWEILGC